MEVVQARPVVDRCRRETGIDQLDAPPVEDLVVRRRDDGLRHPK
jgi:hypothetical protein